MATRGRRGPVVAAAVVVSLVCLVVMLAGGAWFMLRGRGTTSEVSASNPRPADVERRGVDSRPSEPDSAVMAAKREAAPENADRGTEPSSEDALRVQIVDAHGRPQPGLFATFGPRGEELSDSSLRARAEGSSAIATLRGVRSATRSRGGSRVAEWGVSVLVPSRAPPFVPIDLTKLPAEPVVVRLPPCGRLELSFLGRDARPISRPIEVRLLAIPRSDDVRADADGDLFEGRFVVDDGFLELPSVECGLRFDVRYEFDFMRGAPPRFDGPAAEGEKVSREFTCEYGPIAFLGTILDGHLRPVAHRRLTLRVIAVRGRVDGTFATPFVGEGESGDTGALFITIPIAGSIGNPTGAASAFDCEIDVRSPTGPDQTLKAVATVMSGRAPTVSAGLGQLRLYEH